MVTTDLCHDQRSANPARKAKNSDARLEHDDAASY